MENLQDFKLALTRCQNLSKPDGKISSCQKPTAYNRSTIFLHVKKFDRLQYNRSTMVMGGVS
jgi:hypothetical protein